MNNKSINQKVHAFCILCEKIPTAMRMTLLFLFVLVFQLQAEQSYSQTTRISLDMKNSSIEKILQTIEEKSEYYFLYNSKLIDVDRKIDIQAKEESIASVLNRVFAAENVEYEVKGTQIILHPKEMNRIASELIANVQQQRKQISGTITDVQGEPIIGANIIEEGTNNGTITDVDGKFSLQVDNNALLQISYIGYLPQDINTAGRTAFDIILLEDTRALDEVVVVGYGTQKKVTLTGAVVAVRSDEIIATKNENVQNMLTGKLPGVRVAQKTSEPGVFSNSFDIRGFGSPLIVIDGVPRDNMTRLDANDIESISVLKDASAAVYGVRAANGVVLITTKKGTDSKLELNYTGTYSIQVPSGLPKNVDAVGWFALYNEKFLREQGHTYEGEPAYSQEFINEYRNGTREGFDWYPLVIRDSAPQSQHNLSASGSTGSVNYFFSMGYLTQQGFLKSNDLFYDRFNVRSNVSAKIANNITAELQVAGTMDEKNQPHAPTPDIFRALWRQNPIDPVYANNNPEYLAYQRSVFNPIAFSDASFSGYQKLQTKWFQSSFALTYDLPFIEGLSVKGMGSYDYRINNNKVYQKEYDLYIYDAATDTYNPNTANAPSSIQRSFAEYPSTLLQMQINYNRLFNKEHQLNGLLLYEEQTREADNFSAYRELALTGLDELFAGKSDRQIGTMSTGTRYKYANKGLVGRLAYDYMSKYMAELSFRYDGSSKFHKNNRWGFFPATSVGWRISEEPFFKDRDALSFVNNFKLRASYGVLGDDSASSYQFITGYNYPAATGAAANRLGGYVFDGSFVSSVAFKNLANTEITWFEVKTLNVGFDTDLWNGLLGIQFDAFNRKRDGLLATRLLSLPGSVGAALPQENMNSDEVKGIEVALTHRNRVNDFRYDLSGNFSLTRKRWLHYDQAKATSSHNYWLNQRSNRYDDIMWGYEVIGQFESHEEIANSDVYYGPDTLPGDFKYLDWNNDGVIDGNDVHPIANNNGTPKIYFGLSTTLAYKNFDLSLLLQGAALANVVYPAQLATPLLWNDSALDYFLDRWRPADPLASPYDPNTEWVKGKFAYGANTAAENSSFRIEDASYVRLKSLEIGYTLSKIRGFKQARIFLNGYNLFSLSGIEYVDPEHPSDTSGYIYPLNITFNLGVNVSF